VECSGLFQELGKYLGGVVGPDGLTFCGQAGTELEQAPRAVGGHERGPAREDFPFLFLPEVCGNAGISDRKDAAKPAADGRLLLFHQAKPERPKELRGLVPQFEFGQVVTGIMIIEISLFPCLDLGKVPLGGHEGGKVVNSADEARGHGIEPGIKVLEQGMAGRTNSNDDVRIFSGEGFQVFPGQIADSVDVAEMIAGCAATHLFLWYHHPVSEVPQ